MLFTVARHMVLRMRELSTAVAWPGEGQVIRRILYDIHVETHKAVMHKR